MRLSVRLNFSLVASVAVVSLGLALYQTNAERRGLRRELDRRALVVAESLEKSAAPLMAGRHADLQRLIDSFANHEKLAGAAVYDSQGHPLAVTPGLASVLAAQSGAVSHTNAPNGQGQFFDFNGRTTHAVALPIIVEGIYAGSLEVLHDAGYIDAQAASLWRHAFLGMVVQTLLIVCVTLLILRWSLRKPLAHLAKWLAEARGGAVSAGPD